MRVPSQCLRMLNSHRGSGLRHTSTPTMSAIEAPQKPCPTPLPMKPFMARNPVSPLSAFSAHDAMSESPQNTVENSMLTLLMESYVDLSEDPKPTRSGYPPNINLLPHETSLSMRRYTATSPTPSLPKPLRARGCLIHLLPLLQLRG